MPSEVFLLLVVVVAVALIFDFSNGFHDAANAIATSVSTRALSPLVAVGLAAVLNLAGALISTKIATTIVTTISDPTVTTPHVVLGGLIGAIGWNVLTWILGLPTSSSHALLAGLTGAVVAAVGFSAVFWNKVLEKIIIPTVLSPLGGILLGLLVMTALYWLFRRSHPGKTNRYFRYAQSVSASFMAFSHGSNDAQKTMGVITFALVSAGVISAEAPTVPLWVILSAAVAMAAGTFIGGWRIIKTMGMRIVKLEPINGFAAETTAASVLMANAYFGFPVSTTHVISSSIMGVGATKRLSAVRWGVARTIILAWFFTLPGAALLGAGGFELTRILPI